MDRRPTRLRFFLGCSFGVLVATDFCLALIVSCVFTYGPGAVSPLIDLSMFFVWVFPCLVSQDRPGFFSIQGRDSSHLLLFTSLSLGSLDPDGVDLARASPSVPTVHNVVDIAHHRDTHNTFPFAFPFVSTYVRRSHITCLLYTSPSPRDRG